MTRAQDDTKAIAEAVFPNGLDGFHPDKVPVLIEGLLDGNPTTITTLAQKARDGALPALPKDKLTGNLAKDYQTITRHLTDAAQTQGPATARLAAERSAGAEQDRTR